MGKVIAVANQKGGVGKTTTAVNLSSCLSFFGKKILLIDADAQGNATSGLGIDKRAVEVSAYDVLIDEAAMESVVLQTEYPNLWICPANINLAGAEIELVSKQNREFMLQGALNAIKVNYDFVIIDCPPALGLLTLNSFIAADTVLIPIQCEYYALEGLSQLTSTIKHIKKGLNPRLDIEGVLLTMFDARTNLSIQVIEEVKKYFGQKVYKSVVPRNVRLSEAPSFGRPINYYDPASRGAEAYLDLAQEVIEYNKEAAR